MARPSPKLLSSTTTEYLGEAVIRSRSESRLLPRNGIASKDCGNVENARIISVGGRRLQRQQQQRQLGQQQQQRRIHSGASRLCSREGLFPGLSSGGYGVPCVGVRGFATSQDDGGEKGTGVIEGPMGEYNARVAEGNLKDDPHQRGMYETRRLSYVVKFLTSSTSNDPIPPRTLRRPKVLRTTGRHQPSRP